MKKSVIILWAVAALLLIGAFTAIFQGDASTGAFGFVFAAACAVGGFLLHKKHKAAIVKARQEEAERETARKHFEEANKKISFAVAGVTFKNDGGGSRQTILKRKMKEQEDGIVAVSLEQYEYEGKPAVAVMLDDEQVGSVPNSHLPEILNVIRDNKKVTGLSADIEDFEDEEGKHILRCDILVQYTV
jgi:hypothetical protein